MLTLPLDSDAIKAIIPHRDPFLLIDEIVELVPGQKAVGIKRLTGREDWFRGHFPDYPVMPGVLIVEALAQTGAVAILGMPENKGKIAFFAGIDKLRFKRQVLPGEELLLTCEIIKVKGPVGKGAARATVNGELAVQGELMFAVQ
jgi:3-hydroxyacyl-[acyl-carrier-protein] dehydratase